MTETRSVAGGPEMEKSLAVLAADDERKRKLALLKAVGLDRVAPEQRELALAIAKRYDLDLLLKHLVLIEGRPYMTRDALLWIAHRSGQFNGIAVTKPEIIEDYWYAEATVWRKDMSHPFVYGGRYPTKGGNQKFAPEMAVKVAESMALRRAFNVSAPSADERWDAEVPAAEPEPPKSLAEKVAEKAAAVVEAEFTPMPIDVSQHFPYVPIEETEIGKAAVAGEQAGGTPDLPIPEPAPPKARAGTTTAKQTTPTSTSSSAEGEQCGSYSKLSGDRCRQYEGHGSLHRTDNEAWMDADGRRA